jgi:2-polyprenyl-3-methyl-5-hydroxy-6-metoxy-1,4-benzoquinol methylase
LAFVVKQTAPQKSMQSVIADFDGIADAIARDARPDVFTSAERFLLRHVPANAKRALDVGCGDGALSRALAERGIATVGIDASPRMIELARTLARGNALLEYRTGDVMTDAPLQPVFDVAVSVSMAHHVPLEQVVNYLRAAVAPGGTLIIQDITTRTGLRDLPVNALAAIAQRLRLVPGATRRSKLRSLYDRHGIGEKYLRPSAVADAYRAILPGAHVYLHLEWRYTVIWRADGA